MTEVETVAELGFEGQIMTIILEAGMKDCYLSLLQKNYIQ